MLLKKAKMMGDILIVGINSDESVKRIKGSSRPINNLDDRLLMLSNFEFIDYLIPFNEDTPLNLIKTIRPNILVKGGDYIKEEVIGKEFSDNVVIIEYISGYSSTNIISKLEE